MVSVLFEVEINVATLHLAYVIGKSRPHDHGSTIARTPSK